MIAAAVLSVAPRTAVARPVRISYQPPVDAPIVDRFRPPPSPWAAGNRGIDYATAPGTAVRAAAAGEVTFAGQVGGELHVVVLHGEGVRTSYSFLRSVAVVRGHVVDTGDVVGTSGPVLHFGARVGADYVDPLLLLAGESGGRARLVPDSAAAPPRVGHERRSLRRLTPRLPPVRPVPAGAVAWARRGAGPVR